SAVGRPLRRVSSFGGLAPFPPEHRPAGAADRCLDCGVEPDCPYSAVRFYTRCLTERGAGWPLDAVVDDYTQADLLAALRHGPYGRCVYGTDNDVVDHQVVAMEFDGAAPGTFPKARVHPRRPPPPPPVRHPRRAGGRRRDRPHLRLPHPADPGPLGPPDRRRHRRRGAARARPPASPSASSTSSPSRPRPSRPARPATPPPAGATAAATGA